MPRSSDPEKNKQAPNDDGVSSSRDTLIDLSPPPNDSAKHPDSNSADDEEEVTGVMEVKKWDPHKAEKDIEVGDFYFKRKNYAAALSRYREALEYKPKDAVATFRLAQTLENTGELQEALKTYEDYLRILKNGPFAADARKGVERLQQKTQRSSKE
jgi:tetratricopeptide (TPR) repeat protein